MAWSFPNGAGDTGLLGEILALVRAERGFDATGYCPAVIASRIESRIAASAVSGRAEYVRLLQVSPAELDLLVEALTLKVSSFFRDPVAFEYLAEFVLPSILAEKVASGERTLRIWSAGCANGEEPYSVAILLHALSLGGWEVPETIVFATDVDRKALERGRAALYPAESLANVRQGLVAACFIREGDLYRVAPAVASRVRFSAHDMLDRRTVAPAESIFASFDLVLCRNLLIYFMAEYQDAICSKLYRSLSEDGYLMLGQTETVPEQWRGALSRVTDCCRLYRKSGRAPNHEPGR